MTEIPEGCRYISGTKSNDSQGRNINEAHKYIQ